MKIDMLINLVGLILLLSGFSIFILGYKTAGAILSFAGVIVYLIVKSMFSKT